LVAVEASPIRLGTRIACVWAGRGLALGLGRMAAGGHFLSDVI
jgi:membrane-associated phospholipid phosphatase